MEKRAITRSAKKLTVEERRKLKKFAEIIRAEREKQKLTLYQIEERGYNYYQHWQSIESGERNFTFTTLLSICEVLKKHPSELLKDL